jgi:hypothetical protein
MTIHGKAHIVSCSGLFDRVADPATGWGDGEFRRLCRLLAWLEWRVHDDLPSPMVHWSPDRSNGGYRHQ